MKTERVLEITREGKLNALGFISGGESLGIGFRKDEYAGPKWYVESSGSIATIDIEPIGESNHCFEGTRDGIVFSLQYAIHNSKLDLTAKMRNNSPNPFEPEKAGLKIGIDTYMDAYPEWDEKYFPTLLRCEKTHFWGYLMSPVGKILAIASPDPIASWSLDYNRVNAQHIGHRVYTFNLDLLNTMPLPDRHPHDLVVLQPGEERSWAIYFEAVDNTSEIKPLLSVLCDAPMFELEKYTVEEGEKVNVQLFGRKMVELEITTPTGQRINKNLEKKEDALLICSFVPDDGFGVYTLRASTTGGKKSEATFYVRKPWSWYLKQARIEAVNKPQKATTHLESWYGYFSAFLARKHFPDPELDAKTEESFRRVLALMFDIEKAEPISDPGRICNTSVAISMLTDLYEAKGDILDLELAARLADFLLEHQVQDGSYRAYSRHQNDDGGYYTTNGAHYTSVAYLAKSLLELVLAEKGLVADSEIWRKRYEKHYQSAKAAIDDLQRRKDNVATEGQSTFEDGMIACTSMQLGMFALLQVDVKECRKYADIALYVQKKHRCLEQSVIPDCRMRGATLRFWEAQYDVLSDANMISSPHGWTSWKTYATWYLYQLTGEEHFLKETMDTLGSCVQQIDIDTGNLRWAFICDPQIRAGLWVEDEANPGEGKRVQHTIGEQYVDMISGWWKAPENKLVGAYANMPLTTRDGLIESDNHGGCCDNDVHEHFKCLEEVALTSAYVIQCADGDVKGWNCNCKFVEGTIHVFPAESVVNSVHFNLRAVHDIVVHFSANAKESQGCVGMMWVRQ